MLGAPDFHPNLSLAVDLFCTTKALFSEHLCCLLAVLGLSPILVSAWEIIYVLTQGWLRYGFCATQSTEVRHVKFTCYRSPRESLRSCAVLDECEWFRRRGWQAGYLTEMHCY